MMAQLLSLPACWGKIAQISGGGERVSERSQGIIFREIVSSLKTAGMNPFEIQGFFIGLTEAFPKSAGTEKVATESPPPVTTAQSSPATTTPPDTTPPATTPPVAADHKIHLGFNVDSLKNLWDKGVAVVGDTVGLGNTDAVQNASRRVLNAEAKKTSPVGYGLAESLFPDEAQRSVFLDHLRQGNWMKALSQGGEALMENPTVKEWAPFVVPTAATMAATRLAGGTWGQGALLGAGVGAAYGGYIKPSGGFEASYRKMFSGQPTADGKDPAANAPVIAGETAQQKVTGQPLTGAEQIQQAGNQHATGILKTNPAK